MRKRGGWGADRRSDGDWEPVEKRALDAMALVEGICAELGTRAYIWGGWSLDIYSGRVLREHSDIDCFVVDLHWLFVPFGERLLAQGWEVRDPLDGHLLWARKEGVKLHLGHVELDSVEPDGVGMKGGSVVNWKHNGNDGSILFPAEWLRPGAVRFMGVEVHVVEPELSYVLKMDPHLMNSGWAARDKDRADIEVLRALLADRHVDLGALPGWVKSV